MIIAAAKQNRNIMALKYVIEDIIIRHYNVARYHYERVITRKYVITLQHNITQNSIHLAHQ